MFESEKVYSLHKNLFIPGTKSAQMFISLQGSQREVVVRASKLFFEHYGISNKGNMLAIFSALFIEEIEKEGNGKK